MKIKNKLTNHVFNLPKDEVNRLIEEQPNVYEKFSRKKKKDVQVTAPLYEQNTILPLIWEEEG